MTQWRPLSQRGDDYPAAEETLHEGVPAHLTQALLYWIDSLFDHQEFSNRFPDSERRAGRIAARLRLDLRSVPEDKARSRGDHGIWSASRALVCLADKSGGTLLLDAIDATLADGVAKNDAKELGRLLTDGGSAWHVADDATGLQRRVDPTATEALRAVTAGTSAAAHLNAAWAAAYGRHPATSRAYSEAIKAVEAACIPVVLPQDRIATLGKVIGELKQHEQQWHLAISAPGGNPADISTVMSMLRLLWQGQTDRHGSSQPTTPVTAQAAEAAVHLAITLVQWFQSGVVRPRQ
jgi:hypothetical protein